MFMATCLVNRNISEFSLIVDFVVFNGTKEKTLEIKEMLMSCWET